MAKIPDIKAGDLVKVYSKIKEGEKERTTTFQGIVIQIKGMAKSKTFTVRKISAGIGVERIFPLHSPMIRTEIKKKGKVRRAKLNYLRQRKGRKMKIKEVQLPTKQSAPEKSDAAVEVAAPAEPVAQKSKDPAKTQDKTAAPKEKQSAVKEKTAEPDAKTTAKKTEEPKDESAPGQESVEKA
jgi:large subunit ribosomal protein L19